MTSAEIVQAATVIRDTAFDIRHHNEHAVATAHASLARGRHALPPGPLRDAINHYLDDDTWHQGIHVLLNAVHQVAHHAGLADHTTAGVAVQPRLFDLDPLPNQHRRR